MQDPAPVLTQPEIAAAAAHTPGFTLPGFVPLAAMTVVSHTITYMLMGALAYNVFHYAEILNKPNSGMHPTTSLWVVFGPALQAFRGVLFASVFYPFREKLFGSKRGWLLMAWILIGIGILGTFAAPAGSLEGYIYTMIPVAIQMRGYLEIVPQALLLSALLFYWVRHPRKLWVTVAATTLWAICVILPVLSLFAPKR